MLRFLSSIVLAVPLILSEPAQAECFPNSIHDFREFAKNYEYWRHAGFGSRKHHKRPHHRRSHHGWPHHERPHHRRPHHGGCKKGRHGWHHRPPPPILSPCIVDCILQETTKHRYDNLDKGFCSIKNNKYQSDVFKLVGQPHMLFIYVLNNELRLELVKFNNTSNITDDDRYYAEPEGFSRPAEPSQTPLAAYSEMVQKESNKLVCDNSRSLVWGVNEGKALPNYFAGKIDLFHVKDALYTKTALTTDLTSSAYMDIVLKKVPDKPTK